MKLKDVEYHPSRMIDDIICNDDEVFTLKEIAGIIEKVIGRKINTGSLGNLIGRNDRIYHFALNRRDYLYGTKKAINKYKQIHQKEIANIVKAKDEITTC